MQSLPTAHVAAGSVVCFETKDCFGGYVHTEKDLVTEISAGAVNQAAGPVYIDGAKAGDVLRVEIRDIRLARQGSMMMRANTGLLGEYIHEPHTKVTRSAMGKPRLVSA